MLLVPSQGRADAAAETLTNAVFTSVPQGRTFYYRVNRGDTLAGHRVPLRGPASRDLRRWNGLASDRDGDVRTATADHERSRAERCADQARAGEAGDVGLDEARCPSTKATAVSTKPADFDEGGTTISTKGDRGLDK
jgi:hypothetical protein